MPFGNDRLSVRPEMFGLPPALWNQIRDLLYHVVWHPEEEARLTAAIEAAPAELRPNLLKAINAHLALEQMEAQRRETSRARGTGAGEGGMTVVHRLNRVRDMITAIPGAGPAPAGGSSSSGSGPPSSSGAAS